MHVATKEAQIFTLHIRSVSHLLQIDETALRSWLYKKWDNTNKTRVCGKAANDLLKTAG